MSHFSQRHRLFMHPILTHPRSRSIFLLFLFFAIFGAFVIGREFYNALATAGIDPQQLDQDPAAFVSWLLPVYFLGGLILAGVLIGSALTAVTIVYPARRIEQWLLAAEAGRSVNPMRIRADDIYFELMTSINDLYAKSKKK